MTTADRPDNDPLRRSLLFMPASNRRALEKARSLPCDGVILDLEDAVAPDDKAAARSAAAEAVAAGGFGDRLVVVRVNSLATPWGAGDLAAISEVSPDAVLVPKIDGPKDVERADAALAAGRAQLWAMIETARAHLALPAIAGTAATSRLRALVIGPNDYAKDTGARMTQDRAPFFALFSLAVAAARTTGLWVFDGPYGRIDDLDGLAMECAQARAFGFDGKTLIHPSHVATCNAAFSPTEADCAEARAVVEAFDAPENAGRGAVRVNGRMAERLHLEEAQSLLARARRLEAR